MDQNEEVEEKMKGWIRIDERLPDEYRIVKGTDKFNVEFRVCLINGIWQDDNIDFECNEKYPKIQYWKEFMTET